MFAYHQYPRFACGRAQTECFMYCLRMKGVYRGSNREKNRLLDKVHAKLRQERNIRTFTLVASKLQLGIAVCKGGCKYACLLAHAHDRLLGRH